MSVEKGEKKKVPAHRRGPARKKQKRKGKSDRAVLVLSIISIVSILLLAFAVGYLFKQQNRPDTAAVTPVYSKDSVRSDLESYLFRLGLSQTVTSSPAAAEGDEIILSGGVDTAALTQDMEDFFAGVSQDVWINSDELPDRIWVYQQSTPIVSIAFADQQPVTVEDPVSYPEETNSNLPRIAIVIDDIGRDVRAAEALLAIDARLTYSILPNTENATHIARLVHRSGEEVFLHLPMEPKGYPEKNPGYDPLLVGTPPERIRDLLMNYRRIVPYIAGGNNHMGSRFTEDIEGMDVVLDYFAAENLIFLDSLTSSRSVVTARSRMKRVPVKKRDIFLDNVQDVGAIREQIAKTVAIAERRGEAIAIGHPYAVTIEAIRQEIEDGLSSRVEIVPVSRLFSVE